MQLINSDNNSFNVPVPKIFYSFEKEGIFTNCSVCDSFLLEEGVSYFIEKAFKGTEVIFEYAMCDNCREGMGEEISLESMMNLGNYFMENVDMHERYETLIAQFDNSIKPWVEKCLFTEKQRGECESYQICALCEGSKLIVSFLPFMVSSGAAEEMQELMSKKTRESFDGFIRDVLNPPVDFKDIPVFI